MKTILDYGRYDDDSSHIGCPRAKSYMTPCAARDGKSALTDKGCCVGCNVHPADLLTELVKAVTDEALRRSHSVDDESDPIREAYERGLREGVEKVPEHLIGLCPHGYLLCFYCWRDAGFPGAGERKP